MKSTMSFYKHKFNIIYKPDRFHTQYVELNDGRYSKTFMKNNEITTEYIDLQEYASALATTILRPSRNNNPSL
jgi:hypothetical protein